MSGSLLLTQMAAPSSINVHGDDVCVTDDMSGWHAPSRIPQLQRSYSMRSTTTRCRHTCGAQIDTATRSTSIMHHNHRTSSTVNGGGGDGDGGDVDGAITSYARTPTQVTTCKPPPQLVRGHSFMERGERRTLTNSNVAELSSNANKYKHEVGSNGVALTTLPRRPTHLSAAATPLRRAGGGGSLTPSPTAPRRRTLSLSLRPESAALKSNSLASSSPKTPPTSPFYSATNPHDSWDTDSIASLANSLSSVASCDHASVARNGTTFSGRSMKYVFHCNQNSGLVGDEYLTPTQRVQRQVRKLRQLLQQAHKELDDKDSEILKLTKEIVELRMCKVAINSPTDDKSNSSASDGLVTVKEISSPGLNQTDMTSSYTDSGHFEDYSTHSSQEVGKSCAEKAVMTDIEHEKFLLEYEAHVQELIRMHQEETHQLKQKHNDKVEELLQRITDINGRYWDLVPQLDLARAKIRELEQKLDEVNSQLKDSEKDKKIAFEMATPPGPSRISVPQLLQQLQATKNELDNLKAMHRQMLDAKSKNKIDPEITLQFLKSAIYYFFTDKENSQGHLKAIQSILGFTPTEILNIDKAAAYT